MPPVVKGLTGGSTNPIIYIYIPPVVKGLTGGSTNPITYIYMPPVVKGLTGGSTNPIICTHLICCLLNSLREMIIPMPYFRPFRGGCWSRGFRTLRYSSDPFSKLVERDLRIRRVTLELTLVYTGFNAPRLLVGE